MHVDGNGLYLCVSRSGAKSWIFRYQLNKRRREMGLGSLTTLSAPEARAMAAQLKLQVANGVDPLAERAAAREVEEQERRLAAAQHDRLQRTFRVAAEHHMANHSPSWRNAKHAQQWANTLATYVYPKIGMMPVDEITTSDVVAILQPIWSTKPETASRVRMRIEAVLNSAKSLGWRNGENPAVWKGGLDAVLPRADKVRKVRHHPAMPFEDAPAFMESLCLKDGVGALALRFAILTAARSGEVRDARWDEIDLTNALWVVPAERMKAKREHRVPLSSDALELLQSLPRLANCPLIFPGVHRQPLSDMSLSAVLRRMGLGHFTVHGFRSTFRVWADSRGFPFEVAEAALAHKIGLKEVAAYLRTDHLEQRRPMMEAWAQYLSARESSVATKALVRR